VIGWRTCAAVARVEILRTMRSRISFTLLFMVPAFQIVLFGTAIRPADLKVAIVVAGPPSAAPLAQMLHDIDGIAADDVLRAPGRAAAAVTDHRVKIGVELPAGGAGDSIRVIVDATDPAATTLAENRLRAAYWQKVAGASPDAASAPPLRVERLYNPAARADWGFLPALVGVIMMISAIMFGTLGLAREREQGTWETLLVLPVGRIAVTLGKIAPYTLLGTCQGLVTLALAAGLFGLPVRGSLVALVALMPIFVAAHLALGMAIAARSQTQIAALQGAIAFYLPCMLLSGFLFPLEALPYWAQRVSEALPLTHFIRAARLATLQGGDAAMVASQAIPIAIVMVGAMLLAAVSYRDSRR